MRLSLVCEFILAMGIIGGAPNAAAQIDPSSALLLKNGQQPQTRESGVESGRYTVRPRSPRSQDPNPDGSGNDLQTPVTADQPPTTDWELATPETEFRSGDASSSAGSSSSQPLQIVSGVSAQPAPHSPSVPSQIVPLVQVPPHSGQTNFDFHDDRRLTLIEFSLAPGYLYNNSDSNYSYRQYSINSPTAFVDARVWLRPSFAIDTTYQTTLSGSMTDSASGSRNVTAAQDWFTIGFRNRRFFGASRLSPTLIFGIDYNEYQLHVPSDAVTRGNVKTTGVVLSLESEIPVSFYRAWTVGFSFAPKQQHSEGGSAADFSSGGSVEANAVGLSLGGKFSYDHSSSIFWKISHTVEKDLFSGSASRTDAVTGLKPTGVSVTNSFTFFNLGFTWGN